jgi:hypothetical protein
MTVSLREVYCVFFLRAFGLCGSCSTVDIAVDGGTNCFLSSPLSGTLLLGYSALLIQLNSFHQSIPAPVDYVVITLLASVLGVQEWRSQV